MSDSLDLISTIGTWVGAGIGLIALIGIVGPALIWYASTRDKQKTLDEIGNENNDYLSRGFHMGPNIWLGRQVRAPLLRNADSLKTLDVLPTLDARKIKSLQTNKSWVLYGLLLEAYGIPFKKGDGLYIRKNKALLAVHRSWILTVGLLGRYSDRKNQASVSTGRLPRHRYNNGFLQFMSGPLHHPRGMPPGMPRGMQPRIPMQPSRIPFRNRPLKATDLYGTTGTVSFSSTRPLIGENTLQTATFDLNTSCGSTTDSISPNEMFLLALGFLKMSKTQYLSIGHLTETPEEAGVDLGNPRIPNSIPSSSSSSSSSISSSSSSIASIQINSGEGDPYYAASSGTSEHNPKVEAYQLRQIELDRIAIDLGRPLLGLHPVSTFSLMPISSVRAESVFKELSHRTRVPADSKWIRFPRHFVQGQRRTRLGSDGPNPIYVERIAAQKLAYALQNLRWHTNRYLLDMNDGRGVGLSLFIYAAIDLPQFMHRLNGGLVWLGLTQSEKKKLSLALSSFSDLHPSASALQIYRAAQALDTVLEDLGSGEERMFIDQIIGTLAITNSEFRDQVYDSLWRLHETASSMSVELEMPSATLKVPMAFGLMQHFYVDWQEMFPDQVRNQETLSVSYKVVVLAATRSLVRCAMLQHCPDSRPLLDAVLGIEDVVYMT
ncbi:hypothetical protein PG990_011900 [Apiospora arundinis]